MESPLTVDVLLADRPGEHVTIPYTIHEPVYNLAERVAIQLKEPKKDYHYQELYLEGFHLEYPQLSLDNYRVLGGTLTYLSFKKGSMSFFVKTLTGDKSLCLSCNPDDTVLTVKKILFKREGVPVAQLQLMHQGRPLKDDMTLQSQGIGKLSTLSMSTRMRGGLNVALTAPLKFADVSDSSNVKKRQLVNEYPPGRKVYPGTNIEVTCPCTPKYRVISPVYFGTIELSQEKIPCPNCEKADRTVPVTVGFRTCKYRFHGIKADGTQFTAGWTDVNKEDQYQIFYPKKQTEYSRLVIESAPLDGEDDCPICLKPMKENVETLDCGHRFHEYCQALRPSDGCSSCEFQKLLIKGKKHYLGGLRLRLSD
ncbi:hypothetical protein BGX23_009038 [Mortierella sp. AD031]|nr:hypothetical protein BGX23_009038 [Mortierella sp. AD031]